MFSARAATATLVLLALVAVGAISGCGSKKTGPEIYRVSGSVEFDGKPVPKGFITFRPNTKKGNDGPGGGTKIENGRYETPPGKGVVGGAYIVEIRGSDGVPYKESGEEVPDGKDLFGKYEVEVDFPKENTEKDFTVPKKHK